ncbi:MAG: CoB--CoM heterodisulfide reductase iron-sulfur subunit A family protein [Deltaproteobacteria bacterium]|nr:CoB--CoM heterodisulfide reductase iron-sulfur subunit A family protein [Deltaproteobacteria bacterium]
MTKKASISGAVAVAGGGIGAMQAALDLAEAGFLVHMIEPASSIGGTMVMLDKTFPTGDCSMCMISPKMVEVGRHENIKVHTLSSVAALSGEPGDFTLSVIEKPRYVNPDRCTGCGVCESKCPKIVANSFDQGLGKRRAIHVLFPQAVPNTRVIDPGQCLYLTRKRCRACEKVCTAGAIDFDQTEKRFDLRVGAVILSPGLSRYDAKFRQELGYGRWPNVVTSLQFERILSASGPFAGKVTRPSDHRHPQKIAWIQCVGSRDPHRANPWCSSVCCMYATKQAVIAKEHDSSIEPSVFYMDMRSFGKDFDRYVDRAKNEYGVRYVRAMVSEIREDPGTGNLILRHALENGKMTEEAFHLAVLSVGFQPHAEAAKFAETFGIESTPYGFPATDPFSPTATTRRGVLATGIYQGPKDIPETVVQASAVAGEVMSLLSEARGTEVTEKAVPPEIPVAGDPAKIGVFVCHCGINISQTVDVKSVAQAAAGLPGVALAEDVIYACAQDTQEHIKEMVREKGLNRVVVASCTPRTHEPLFMDTIRDAGLNKYLFELADIREQCSWCHMGQKEEATKKALALVKAHVAKARNLFPVQSGSVSVTPAALVIGGGVAGMTAALSLGGQGFDVHLVEREKELGGLARNLRRTGEGREVGAWLSGLVSKAESHPKITVHKSAQIAKTDGAVGGFTTILDNGETFTHGAIIIAVGGQEYKPAEYGYGERDSVITQRTLEQRIEAGEIPKGASFVMIQCVGSREEPSNYCSRVCCQDAVKNAVAIKEKDPTASVAILYRDVRTYGLREENYKKARDLGVLFFRFDPEKKPEAAFTDKGVTVSLHDFILNRPVRLSADFLVLSAGLRPNPESETIGKLYKLTRNSDGFFLEAHVKLRPVDFPSEGIYLAGLAHAPKNLDETISQAQAAAGRAGALLAHERLAVSGIISKHNRDICMSCLACVRACPYGSPFIDSDGKVSHNEVKCMGCGICAGVCPAKAWQVNKFTDTQVMAMIDSLTDGLHPAQKEAQ